MGKIIEVTQKPVIEYSIIQQISQEVDFKIQSLNIDTLEANEDNLATIKNVRADLNKDFTVLEEQRKMVKDIVLKDYNTFEEQYKQLIANKFKDADSKLKGLVDTVSDEILNIKINGLKEYFNEVNKYDFVKFEDLQIKIIKSISDKKIKEDIDTYLVNIQISLETIETLPNKERILAKFQMNKNLNESISQTNIEIQREEAIKKQQEEQKRQAEERQAQYEQQQRDYQERTQQPVIEEPIKVENEVKIEDEKTYKTSFTVFGTKAQFAKLKEFMKNEGIRYE